MITGTQFRDDQSATTRKSSPVTSAVFDALAAAEKRSIVLSDGLFPAATQILSKGGAYVPEAKIGTPDPEGSAETIQAAGPLLQE